MARSRTAKQATADAQAKQQLTEYLTGLARTVVPMVVGVIVTLALRWAHVDLHGYTPEITAGVSAAYYAAVHWAERYINPTYGRLLAIARTPTYTKR